MEQSYDITQGARRMAGVKPSMIRTIMNRAAELQNEGKPMIKFSVGEPDFDTPSDIKEAAIRALTNNKTHYGSNKGDPALRKKISASLKAEIGIDYDPETEITVTCGAAEALNNAILTFVDPGDEVVVLQPAFVTYSCLIGECEAKMVEVPMDPALGFQVNMDALEAAVSEKTKMLVLNNPSNPTGAVFGRPYLEKIAELAKKFNFLVLADEIYSRLVYDGAEFISMASLPGMKERTILVSGFSKTYAMTGWRLGYLAAPAKMTSLMLRTHQYSTTCAPTFIQIGVSEGMDTPRTKREVDDMVAAFARRRELIMKELDTVPGLTYAKPYGAFYIMVNVRGLGLSGTEFSKKLLEEKYVASVPAIGLGENTDSYVRFSYATSDENIVKGMERVREMAKELLGQA